MRLQLLLMLMTTTNCVFCQDDFVFIPENPFYDDQYLIDRQSFDYIKAKNKRYVRKSINHESGTDWTIEYFYNTRFALDSVVETVGSKHKKLTIYRYDTQFRLVAKIDSFKTSRGWDSIYQKNWTYKRNGDIEKIEQGWSFYDQPGFLRHQIMPSIILDTMTDGMLRYKSGIFNLNGAYLWPELDHKYYYIRNGWLVWYGTAKSFTEVSLTNDGAVLTYTCFNNDTAILKRTEEYNFNRVMLPVVVKVLYEGAWHTIEKLTYDSDGKKSSKMEFNPLENSVKTITYKRGVNGRIEEEFNQTIKETVDPVSGDTTSYTSVSSVSYHYSKKRPSK